jgi:RecB family exonuclease
MDGVIRRRWRVDAADARAGRDPIAARIPQAEVITPRRTRLVRVGTLQAFRDVLVRLACAGTPAHARDRLVVVPTRAAATHLRRTIEDARLADGGAVMLPEFVTRGELMAALADRLPPREGALADAEREVLLGIAARAAQAAGYEAPFRLRPGLLAEMLRFYDELRRHRNTIDDFARRALDRLEPGAEHDRGAARLVLQTRFLVAAFREFEERSAAAGADEHTLRERLLAEPVTRPWQQVILAVTDRAFDAYGLYPADWDLLARIPGLLSLDVVVTDTVLAGALHERMHAVLPGVEEVRGDGGEQVPEPTLLTPHGSLVHVARDREEEIAQFARRIKQDARATAAPLDRIALVVQQPLPYVYLAREVLRAAGIPCQLFDALPLAAEPFSAALDLVCSAVSSGFGRAPMMALLASPHFRFGGRASGRDRAALDRALAEAGYLGDPDALDRLIDAWTAKAPERGLLVRALRAATVMREAIGELAPLRESSPVATHLHRLRSFLAAHEQVPGPDDPLRLRQLRARGAILGTLASLQQAYERFDDAAVEFDQVAALVRRWIEGQTFQPRTGDAGVHVVDAASARFGGFDEIQLAGLVDGEWPERPRRNIFYSPSVLRDLGWPAEADRLDGARAAFVDLLRLPAERLVLSTFTLEADAVVSPSLLIEEAERAGLPAIESALPAALIFDFERLAMMPDPADPGCVADPGPPDQRAGQLNTAIPLPAYSLSALERYQDCPFKFFAADVLRLEEVPEDESMLSPRARGRFIHEVFQRFFEAWDARAGGTITSDRLDAARALFQDIAEPLLERLPEADASLERTRLFGSAISVGIVDVVLGLEASKPVPVRERLLEHRFEGEFSVGATGRRVALKGVADRIDLLDGRRLRVVDYKSGSAPNPRRALQVPIYALCAQEELSRRDGEPWTIDDAAYVALTGKRTLVPVVKAGMADPDAPLGEARARLFAVLDGIAAGVFPPRPHDEMMCRYCAFPSVCRKDYVGDE